MGGEWLPVGTQFGSSEQGEKLWSRFRPKLGRGRHMMVADRGQQERGCKQAAVVSELGDLEQERTFLDPTGQRLKTCLGRKLLPRQGRLLF